MDEVRSGSESAEDTGSINNVAVPDPGVTAQSGDAEPAAHACSSPAELRKASAQQALVRRRGDEDRENSERLTRLFMFNAFDRAIVNVSYSFDMRRVVPESALVSVSFIGLDALGLSYSADTGLISGVPRKLGKFTVTFSFSFRGQAFTRNAELTSVSLWKNNPVPAGTPFMKPDEDSAFIAGAEDGSLLSLAGASKRGRSHAQDGRPRDDDFCIDSLPGTGWQFASVADGAGSARFSRRGSELAAEAGRECFRKSFSVPVFSAKVDALLRLYTESGDEASFTDGLRQLFAPFFSEIVRSYLDKADAEIRNYGGVSGFAGMKREDFYTTFLCSLVRKFSLGRLVVSFSVGDGAIGLVDASRGISALLNRPDEGQYFGETMFLSENIITEPGEVAARINIKLVDRFDALLLMTDGVTDPVFSSDRNLNDMRCWLDFWNGLSQTVVFSRINAELERQLLGWLDFWSRGNHDDRTLVAAF